MPPHPPRSGPGGTPSAIQASMAALGLDDPAWMPREIKSTLPPLKLTLDGASSGRWVAPPSKPDVDLSALQSADIPGGLYVALDGHAGSANLRSMDAFNTFGPGRASGIVGQQLELDQDEGKYKDEEDIDPWRPREIKSTLPPLEIKEIPSTLPPLTISSSSPAGNSAAKSRTPLPAGPAVASRDGKLAPVNTRPKAPDLLSTIAAAMLEETYEPGLGAIYDIPAEDRGVYITLTPLQGGGRNDFGAMAGAGAIGGTLELYSNAKGDTTDADWAKSAQASVGWQSEVAKLAAKSGGSTSAAPAADTEIPALPPPWAVPLPPPPTRSKAAPTSSSSSLPSLPSSTPPPSLISFDAAPPNPLAGDTTLISPVELPTTMPPLRLDVPTSIRPTPDMKPVAPRPPLPAGSSLAASTKPPAGQQPLKTVAVMPFDAVNHEVVDFDRGVCECLDV
ncbi:hypothetical protein M427DRAFT_468281 [Gonapodya prolifera JEL478]|uniref:Uncharacterized protein n=1 Tax=Gonapodya prolifera (strain JEL478) TaxID=1344416 RepID=A0A139A1Z9_GONPJ|nr:hypothetical protein M427DRAFT_468281 [Gonapodya prolifera JEL478]|eukprot:KXS10668.1 hypothetical protein M427DRAFT_468281 [Gonapodya prolifera JEL478]